MRLVLCQDRDALDVLPGVFRMQFQEMCRGLFLPCLLRAPHRRMQMDRASEFVGRSLYVLESAAMESFRPVDGACRLDATVEVNKTYFAAMFRHMQVQKGCDVMPRENGVENVCIGQTSGFGAACSEQPDAGFRGGNVR